MYIILKDDDENDDKKGKKGNFQLEWLIFNEYHDYHEHKVSPCKFVIINNI